MSLVIALARVIASKAETPSVFTIRLERPNGFEFKPVQFVGLELETEQGPEEYSMSLASSPTRPYLEFGARISDSPWKRAFRALRPGDEVEIDGPYGHFVLDESRPAVFVAGGIGITPLKGMMEYATDKGLGIPLLLLYSSRTEPEIAYRGEIDELARRNRQIRVVHTLTRAEGSGWPGRTGRIDAATLSDAVRNPPEAIFYVCGLPGMVEDAYRALRSLDVPKDRIRYEQFWGYE